MAHVGHPSRRKKNQSDGVGDVFKDIFDSLDKDGDGSVSKKDLIDALRANERAMKIMNLEKGTTLRKDNTFHRHFTDIAGPNCDRITWDQFRENMGVIHFLLLQAEYENPEDH
eukprot:TRINITY_DN2144_c0_g1_i1.p1 TRINITY_DN2144_c0_g1~~TRINITY_DN2144_c0_g1_i1.p1  ORF type:complete len:130 (+),score=40.25 TRINITY_DN2144_c0_g1_i1:52-390(+)